MFVVLYKSLLVLFLCFIMFVILFCFEKSIIVVDIKGDIWLVFICICIVGFFYLYNFDLYYLIKIIRVMVFGFEYF